MWSREGARGEGALQRRGCPAEEGVPCRGRGALQRRGCPAEEGHDAERGSIGKRQPDGAARGGQTLFASPACKCGPRTQLSQQVA